nr:retrotransposon protein, putative, unclassified [Tanacetum cinerariifolium]
QVYVDDIIFGSTKKSLCDEFEALMQKRFQMSSIEELTFFLRLQVKQSEERIFISQDKYLKGQPTLGLWYPRDSLFNLEAYSDNDYAREKTESHAEFHRIVDFLTSSSIHHSLTVSPTIYVSNIKQFWNSATSQTINDEKQIHAIVDGKTVVITESSVRRDLLFTDDNGITCLTNEQIFEKLLLMGNMIRKSGKKIGTVTLLFATILAQPAVLEGGGASLLWAATTASLDAQQDISNITKTQSKATLNEPTPQGEGSGSGPEHQETMGGAMAHVRHEGALIHFSDPPLSTGHIVGSGEDMMEHKLELMYLVPQSPHDSPLSGCHTPGSDEDLVIQRFLKKVNRLEKKQRERTPGMKLFKIGTSNKKTLDKENVSKKERDESNKTEELNLSNKGSGETEVVDYTTTAEKDVNVDEPVSTTGDAVNAASVIPVVSVVGPSTMIHDVEEEPRRATPPPTVQSQDKGKGKMVKPKSISKNPIKAQIQRDAEIAKRLFEEEQAQFDKEQRITREKTAKQKAKDAALIKQMEDVQARIDADALLA